MKTVKKYQSKKTSADTTSTSKQNGFAALKEKGMLKDVPKVDPRSKTTTKPKTYVWDPNAKPKVYDGTTPKMKKGGTIKKKK
jgi:hypothetical protein